MVSTLRYLHNTHIDEVNDKNTMASIHVTTQELAACFGAGVLVHLAVFRRGEWDDYSLAVLKVTATLQILLTVLAHQYYSPALSVGASLQHASLWTASAVAGVYTSLVVYRASPWHRLSRFAGPLAARVSTGYMTWRSMRRGQVYEDVRALHAQYGDYVRLGPSEMSLADPAAFAAVHAATSQCERGPWYEILNPTVSLQMVRDRKEHARRRKPWDRGFSAKALRDYEARVAKYTDDLLAVVDRFAADGKESSTNASKWFNYYSFDIMGDFAFGKPFNMMRDGVDHYFFKTTHANMVLIGIFSVGLPFDYSYLQHTSGLTRPLLAHGLAVPHLQSYRGSLGIPKVSALRPRPGAETHRGKRESFGCPVSRHLHLLSLTHTHTHTPPERTTRPGCLSLDLE